MRRTPRLPSKRFIPHLGPNPMVQATATPYQAYVAIPAGNSIGGRPFAHARYTFHSPKEKCYYRHPTRRTGLLGSTRRSTTSR